MDGARVEWVRANFVAEDQDRRPDGSGRRGHRSGTTGNQPAVLMMVQLHVPQVRRPGHATKLLTLGQGFAWLKGPGWFADANQLLDLEPLCYRYSRRRPACLAARDHAASRLVSARRAPSVKSQKGAQPEQVGLVPPHLPDRHTALLGERP